LTSGTQTIENVGSDAGETIAFVRSTFKPKRLVVFGRSIGSISTIEGCSRANPSAVDGVILESGFSTKGLRLRVESRLGCPFGGPLINLSESLAKLTCPVLLMHAKDDEVVPFSPNFTENESCLKGNNPKSTMLALDVGRHNIRSWNRVAVFQEISKFLTKIVE
jgi:pimeloyl-ACP methyl ester carboxylesterase